MHFNHQYLLDFTERQSTHKPDFTILDFGCGAGEVVLEGRRRGFNIFGAEIFYAGENTRPVVENSGLMGTVIREIADGKVDFPDATFDLVLSNQVFEHVEDLEPVLHEICRVLKPGGQMLALFPSREVWREGHRGIPFLHWFAKDSRVRYPYALLLRRLGFGSYKYHTTPAQWTRDSLSWLDNYCFYRDRRAIVETFSRCFKIRFIEDDYIRLRLRASGLQILIPFATGYSFELIAQAIFRKLGGLVLLAAKPS
jgi:SAM-dependent methyltransferase